MRIGNKQQRDPSFLQRSIGYRTMASTNRSLAEEALVDAVAETRGHGATQQSAWVRPEARQGRLIHAFEVDRACQKMRQLMHRVSWQRAPVQNARNSTDRVDVNDSLRATWTNAAAKSTRKGMCRAGPGRPEVVTSSHTWTPMSAPRPAQPLR